MDAEQVLSLLKDSALADLPSQPRDTVSPERQAHGSQGASLAFEVPKPAARERIPACLEGVDGSRGGPPMEQELPRAEEPLVASGQVSLDQLAVGRTVSRILRARGCRSLSDVLEQTPRELRGESGFGAGGQRELQQAVRQVLPRLRSTDASRAERFIESLRLKPQPFQPPRGVPSDIRALLVALEGCSTSGWVAIIKHRLGLDGGPRHRVAETVAALGCNRNTVILADFRVIDTLRQGSAFSRAAAWLEEALEPEGAASTARLASLLDPEVPASVGDLEAALRLLERVEGKLCPWQRHGEAIFKKDLLAHAHELRSDLKSESLLPMTLANLSARLSQALGREVSEHSTCLLVTEVWGGWMSQDEIVLSCDPGQPSASRWASYAIFRAGGPVAQDEVLAFMDGLPCGRPTSMASVWTVLSAHPLVAKTQSQPSSTWVWLPHLGLTPQRTSALITCCLERVTKRGEMEVDDLCRDLATPGLSSTVLRWLLKRDPRLKVRRNTVTVP